MTSNWPGDPGENVGCAVPANDGGTEGGADVGGGDVTGGEVGGGEVGGACEFELALGATSAALAGDFEVFPVDATTATMTTMSAIPHAAKNHHCLCSGR
jgi:hypothetical protein